MTSIPLRRHSHPCYLVPDLESSLSLGAVLPCLHTMPTGTEALTDGAKGRQEALGLSCGFEPLHHPLTFPCRLVGVLSSVVQIPALAMLHSRHHLSLGCPIASQLVGDHHSWDVLAALQELAEELLSCALVPATLHQDIQHGALLIDGSPQVVPLPVDLEEHFIQVPLVARPCTPLTEAVRIFLPELATPLPHGLVCDCDSPLVQKRFDIPKAEREAMVQPYGV